MANLLKRLTLKLDQPLTQYDKPNNKPASTIPLKPIKRIMYTFLTNDEKLKLALTKITSKSMIGQGSVYDERMGILSNDKLCPVCNKTARDCSGHPGVMQLPFPLPLPVGICQKRIAEYLTCICSDCHRLIYTFDQIRLIVYEKYKKSFFKFQREHRFLIYLEEAALATVCSRCQNPHGKYIVVDDKFFKILKSKSKVEKVPVAYDEICEIILNFREVDFCRLFGLDKNDKTSYYAHPQHMIIQNLCVLPPPDRPYVESNNITAHDDLSYKYSDMANISSKLIDDKKLNEKSRGDAEDGLLFHIKTLIDNGKNKARDPAGRRSLRAIKQRISGKHGHIRGNIQGKRTNHCARSVISPNANLHVDEVGIPEEFTKKLTVPEYVNKYNYDYCTNLLNTDQVLSIIRGDERYDAKYALYTRGFKLIRGDIVIRNNKRIDPLISGSLSQFKFFPGDSVLRTELIDNDDGTTSKRQKLIHNVEGPKRKPFKLLHGDKIERKLRNGDVVLFNRQPSLHEASIIAKKTRLHKFKTLQMDLASTQSFGADFDGDEMNIHIPQSYETRIEALSLMSPEAQFISSADSSPILCIKQDSMVGGYIFTLNNARISKHTFMDTCCTADWDLDYIPNKMKHIKAVYKWIGAVDKEIKDQPLNNCNLEEEALDRLLFTGYGIISMLFPDDFEYTCDNKMAPDKRPVKITRGVIISGTLNKAALGSSSGSLLHNLYKQYGAKFCCDFVTYYQRFMNVLLSRNPISTGIQDCIPTNKEIIRSEQNRCFAQAKHIMQTEMDLQLRENKIQSILNEATNVGEVLARKSLDPDNNIVKMVISGAKGSLFNTVHITSAIGQQNADGKRIPTNYGGRTLPCYPEDLENDVILETEHSNKLELLFQSRGYILSSFYDGLSPQEFFFLSAGGREGLIDVSMKTSKCGYISRRLLKMMEDLKIGYNSSVINAKGNIVQFLYGNDNINAAELIKTEKAGIQISDISCIVEKLCKDYEWSHRSL